MLAHVVPAVYLAIQRCANEVDFRAAIRYKLNMRNRILLLLACCIGLSGAVSCSTRQAPSFAQSPASQADADAKAKKEKAAKSNPAKPESINATINTNIISAPAPDANAPLTKEQKLTNLTRHYINNEITPLEYQTERAEIMAGP